MRLKIKLALIISLSSIASATELPLDSFVCKKSILEELSNFGFKDWNRFADPYLGVKSYRSPSTQFGVWNELRFTEDKTQVKLFRIGPDRVQTVQWDKSCKKTSKEEVSFIKKRLQQKEAWFSDKDLQNVLKKNKKGIVYLWSPGMVYSMKEYNVFKNYAQKNKLAFIPVLDDKAGRANANAAADQYKFEPGARKMASVELIQRSGSAHFPRTFVFSNNKISREPLLGVMPEKTLAKLVTQELKALEASK